MIYRTIDELNDIVDYSDNEDYIAIFTNKKLLYEFVNRKNIRITRDVIKEKLKGDDRDIYENYNCLVCRFHEYYLGHLLKRLVYCEEDDMTIMVME